MLPAWVVDVSQRNIVPTRAGRKKDTFISALATFALRPRSAVTALAPMEESNMAAKKPPCTMPAGLAKRSSARISHTVAPGTDLSTHRRPSVRSQFGGTCKDMP